MKKALIAVVLVLGLSRIAVPGYAGEASPAPPAPVIVARFLGFTEAQAAQFGQLLQNLQATMGGLEPQMRLRQQRLEELLSAEEPDAASIGALLIEIRALQKQAGQAIEAYHNGFQQLLSEEQRQRVREVVREAQLFQAVRAFAEVRLIEPPH